MDLLGIQVAEQGFRSRTYTKSLLKRLQSSVGYPGYFRGKSLYMILFLLKKAFRNKHGKINILHTGLFKPSVQLMLDIFPDRISCRFDHHTAFYTGIVDKLRFFHHIRIPLGKILLHRGDLFHKLLILCHFSTPFLFSFSGNIRCREGLMEQTFYAVKKTPDPCTGTDVSIRRYHPN